MSIRATGRYWLKFDDLSARDISGKPAKSICA